MIMLSLLLAFNPGHHLNMLSPPPDETVLPLSTTDSIDSSSPLLHSSLNCLGVSREILHLHWLPNEIQHLSLGEVAGDYWLGGALPIY